MKKVVILSLLILTTLLVAPKFIGNYVKQERAGLVAQVNENEAVTLTTDSYQPGWFSANVSSTLTVFLDEDQTQKIHVKLIEDLSFGPLMITDRGFLLGLGYTSVKLEFEHTDSNQEFIELVNNKLHIGALLSFNKNVTSFISSDEIRYENADKKLVVGSSSATFIATNQKYIVGDFFWKGLTFVDADQRGVLESLAFTTEQELVSGDYVKGNAILTGDSHFSLQKFDIYHANNHQISLSELTLDNSVSLSDDLLALSLDIKAKEVSVAGHDYQQAILTVMLDKLDFSALQSLNNTLSTISPNISEQETKEILLKALSSVSDRMLVKKPSLKITELGIISEQGKVNSDFTFSLDKDRFDKTNLNATSLMMALDAEANADIPMALLTKYGVGAMVDNFVGQGYVQKKDDIVTIEASFQQGQMTLNGKAFEF
jgi:uncharacterized protein YdgA (DUF945 family)